ncbi:MAG: hypothetical protein P0116_14290 [Candidatus Nitrosocosmicus sp.]|nr:hypothetical protein [Candidatus Nitrosocosmicus sp.]
MGGQHDTDIFPWQNIKGLEEQAKYYHIFLIPENSLEYWVNRLKSQGVSYSGPTKRFDYDEQVITPMIQMVWK